jgi:hypothetical protein
VQEIYSPIETIADESLCSPFAPSRFPVWQREYEAVLHETNTKRLFTWIEVAEAAVLVRLEAIGRNPADHSERKAIDDVLEHLTLLKTERLGFTSKKPTPLI